MNARSYRDRFEDVKAIVGSADDHARHLRMPVYLLNVLLTLVDEEQLRWHVAPALSRVHRTRLLIVLLDRKIPKRDLVVRAGRREDRVLSRMPFDGRNGRRVPGERSHRGRIWRGATANG